MVRGGGQHREARPRPIIDNKGRTIPILPLVRFGSTNEEPFSLIIGLILAVDTRGIPLYLMVMSLDRRICSEVLVENLLLNNAYYSIFSLPKLCYSFTFRLVILLFLFELGDPHEVETHWGAGGEFGIPYEPSHVVYNATTC